MTPDEWFAQATDEQRNLAAARDARDQAGEYLEQATETEDLAEWIYLQGMAGTYRWAADGIQYHEHLPYDDFPEHECGFPVDGAE